jgi:hypothetical protein
VDPREHDPDPEYDKKPSDRFNDRLHGLYVAVRKELDVPAAEKVFREPD